MTNPPDRDRPGSASKATSELAARIASAQKGRQVEAHEAAARASGGSTNLGRAVRLGSEFIAAVLVGTGIGYVLDQWLNTRPWIMLVMLLVGFAAGILNVTRAVAEMNKAAPPPPNSDLGPDDEDDAT
ncbi:MAG TPA: AtpZ/AtpI family protein [Devosiaceae bacterium]|jgi:ATP synthase protein I